MVRQIIAVSKDKKDKKYVKAVQRYLDEGAGDIIVDILTMANMDRIIYGDLQADYISEFELNLREQGFI